MRVLVPQTFDVAVGVIIGVLEVTKFSSEVEESSSGLEMLFNDDSSQIPSAIQGPSSQNSTKGPPGSPPAGSEEAGLTTDEIDAAGDEIIV